MSLILPILSYMSRIPSLFVSFISIIGVVVSWIAKWIGAKLAFNGVFLASVAAGIVVVFLSLKALVLGVSVVLPPYFVQGLNMVIPSNVPICVSTIVSAKFVRWVWDWKLYALESYSSKS